MNIPLDEVIFFDVTTRTPSTSAAVDADSAPTFAVYEESTDTDIGVGGAMTKRTSLTGNYRGTFTLSAANGFEVGKWYSIIASATVGGVTDKCVVKNFRVVAAESTVGVVPSTVASGGISSASFAAGAINAAAIAADAITDAKVASDVTIASVTGAVGSVTGAVGSVTAAVTVGTINANAVNASALASDAVAEIQSGLATAANLATVAGYLDTEVASILAIANKLDSAMELDGAVYRFTVNALEQAPSGGGGGSTDWTADERTAIRTILGIPATGTTPEVPSAGALRVIDDLLDTEIAALITAVLDVPTVAEFEARTVLAANYATATELAKVIKTGEEFTATDGTGTKDVTFTRI